MSVEEGCIMPLGNGWFMDLNNYELIPITEHFESVIGDPKRYRLKPGELNKRNRDKTLINVMKHGFARIRMPNAAIVKDFTFEGWGSWDDILSGVMTFASMKKLPKHTYITMANIKDGSVRQEYLEDIVSGEMKSSRFSVKGFDRRLIAALGRTIARRTAFQKGLISLQHIKPASYGRQLLMSLMMRDARRKGKTSDGQSVPI
jgi:hypothetical protein